MEEVKKESLEHCMNEVLVILWRQKTRVLKETVERICQNFEQLPAAELKRLLEDLTRLLQEMTLDEEMVKNILGL